MAQKMNIKYFRGHAIRLYKNGINKVKSANNQNKFLKQETYSRSKDNKRTNSKTHCVTS